MFVAVMPQYDFTVDDDMSFKVAGHLRHIGATVS